MEHGLKMLSLSAGLILTCMVIGFGMLTYREGRKFGDAVVRSVQDMSRTYEESKWTRYDNVIVGGGDVISCIIKYQEEIPVYVIQGSKRMEYSGNFVFAENLPGTEGHIRLADRYQGHILRDEKEAVSGVEFVLKK